MAKYRPKAVIWEKVPETGLWILVALGGLLMLSQCGG